VTTDQRGPGLGSDAGSRGKPPQDQRALLTAVLAVLRPASTLEVGCSDDHGVGTQADDAVQAELTVCLDALTRQADFAGYDHFVGRLLRSSTFALLISGYEHPEHSVQATPPAAHFHEPLSATLLRHDPGAEIYPLRDEAGITTCLVLKAPPHRHGNDFGAETLRELVWRHPNPLRLAEIRLCAWKSTGFYPNLAARLWEYPVVAGLLADLLPAGSRIVDIGAGVTPLVPYLTALGYSIDTVDPSPIHRLWPPQPDWSEWDFLDYAAAGLARRSWNCTLDQLPRSSTFAGAYSVSVIEHLPAAERRALFGEIRKRLRPAGIAILTVDLVRGSDVLWNRSRGLEVEPPAVHGTLQTLVSEVSAAGFELVKVESLRNWGRRAVVDTCLVVARRKAGRAAWWPPRSLRRWVTAFNSNRGAHGGAGRDPHLRFSSGI
jgi:SAM-dependent methyltransferase